MNDSMVVNVSQLNRYVKLLLSGDQKLAGLLVRGEISNFTRHYKSGHCYFTLKDEQASIKAVMFRSNAEALAFSPENGMAVIVSGSVSLYERDGSYQFYVTDLQPDGVGALHLAYEQLKEKLAREGLFEESRKRLLPRYPQAIGIVTSEGAAALQDMLKILARRYPAAKVVLCPAQVQGKGAAKTVIEGIERLNAAKACDVIIIGRGGGSIEDLWAFNDEALARAIVASRIPLVSAVGHETDFTIADLAADLRAPTPSAAAELVVPNWEEVGYYLDDLFSRCVGALEWKLEHYENRLQRASDCLVSPSMRLDALNGQLGMLSRTLQDRMRAQLEHSTSQVNYLAALVEERSPVRLLARGYSLTSTDGARVVSVRQVKRGDQITTNISDGEILSAVLSIKEQ